MEKKQLGNTPLYATRFGIGALSIGPSHLNLSIDEGSNVIVYAVKNGINVIDTAQSYKTYKYINAALKKLKKEGIEDDLIISSKSQAVTYMDMKNAINEALSELDRSYIDIFFMHEVRSREFEKRNGAWSALLEAKKEGKVHHIGVSTHHTDVAKEMADVKECEIVFGIINYKGMGIRTGLTDYEIGKLSEREINSVMLRHRCLDKDGTIDEMLNSIHLLKEKGKAFYAMKAFGGGNLVKEYTKALDFLYQNKEIDTILVGLGSELEVDDLLNYEKGALKDDYTPDCKGKLIRITKGDCEGCGRCIRICPQGALYFGDDGLTEIDNSKCLTCGYCAMVCPNRAIIMY